MTRESSIRWVDQDWPKPCFFAPDRMENIRHDVPDGCNIRVVTARGEVVCGRVVSLESTWYELRLDPAWVLCLLPTEDDLVKARPYRKPVVSYVAKWESWLRLNKMTAPN